MTYLMFSVDIKQRLNNKHLYSSPTSKFYEAIYMKLILSIYVKPFIKYKKKEKDIKIYFHLSFDEKDTPI